MPDVEVFDANDILQRSLVLKQHLGAIVIGVRIGFGIGEDDVGIVGDQHHADSDFGLIDEVDAVHGDHLGCQAIFHGAAMIDGIFTCGG